MPIWLPPKILWAIYPHGPHTQASSSYFALINHGRFGPDPGQASEKTQAVIHFLFIHPLFSFVVARTVKRGYRRSKLVFFTKAPSSPWSHPHRLGVILIALLTLVYCARSHGFETVLVTLMWVSSVEWQLYHLAAGLVTLQSVSSAPSPCCRLSHSLAVSLVALQSVLSPCCQPPHLAVGRLEICLTALQSAPLPCSRPLVT